MGSVPSLLPERRSGLLFMIEERAVELLTREMAFDEPRTQTAHSTHGEQDRARGQDQSMQTSFLLNQSKAEKSAEREQIPLGASPFSRDRALSLLENSGTDLCPCASRGARAEGRAEANA